MVWIDRSQFFLLLDRYYVKDLSEFLRGPGGGCIFFKNISRIFLFRPWDMIQFWFVHSFFFLIGWENIEKTWENHQLNAAVNFNNFERPNAMLRQTPGKKTFSPSTSSDFLEIRGETQNFSKIQSRNWYYCQVHGNFHKTRFVQVFPSQPRKWWISDLNGKPLIQFKQTTSDVES